MGAGRFSAQPMSEAAAADVDECKALCADNGTCLACDFSASDGLCRLYAEGVTSDVGSGGDQLSFVWQFPRPDGSPPDVFRPFGDLHLMVASPVAGRDAAAACFENSAILYPGVSPERLAALQTAWPELFDDGSEPLVGVEDMVVEGSFVSSDGDGAPTVAWAFGEPNDYGDGEDCAALSGNGADLNDVSCHPSKPALCQYIGENLALGKPSWMNMALPGSPAANGNDGDVSTAAAMSPVGGLALTWNVDLGGPVQVTSVLYLAGATATATDNRDTEIRVGSHPHLFDEQHSARCVLLTEPFVAAGYGRQFRCTEPVTGRYVRLIRHMPNPELDLAELAVFGNRLDTPE